MENEIKLVKSYFFLAVKLHALNRYADKKSEEKLTKTF